MRKKIKVSKIKQKSAMQISVYKMDCDRQRKWVYKGNIKGNVTTVNILLRSRETIRCHQKRNAMMRRTVVPNDDGNNGKANHNFSSANWNITVRDFIK